MGDFSTKEWKASFVTSSAAPAGELSAPAPYLRKEFPASVGVQRATLYVTALGLIEAYVNGERIGEDVLTPG